MTSLTLTEALAELKTIESRIQKKQAMVLTYLTRPDTMVDPLVKDGGSLVVIGQERQAISDLHQRILLLRRAIARANQETSITVNGVTRTLADWLVWRRDIVPHYQEFLTGMVRTIELARQQGSRLEPRGLYGAANTQSDARPQAIVVNLDEKELHNEIERLQDTLGSLDGQLSLKNATVTIDV